MNSQTVSIVAEDIFQSEPLRRMVLRQGFEVTKSERAGDLIRSMQSIKPALIMVVSSRQEPDDGLKIAREIRGYDPQVPLILITSNSSENLAIEALRIKVTDYFKIPYRADDLLASIKRSLSSPNVEPKANPAPLTSDLGSQDQLVGRSLPITRVIASLKIIAPTDCTVLITGETGTGKEVAANLVHKFSPRTQNPFVVINCAAIPDTLLESELFGYERGAFTGAVSRREGAIRSAEGGTVFFDEIGDMSPYAQAKILRTIENKEVWPIGGKKSIPINVRFIAATNRNMEQLMQEGKFRSDLYFRLNVARVCLPPLCERLGDIPLLLDYFREKFNRQFGKKVACVTDKAIAALMEYHWPGNIRELKNLLESSFIRAHEKITINDFPQLFRQRLQEPKSLHQDERSHLLAALNECNWNKTKAALKLKWSRMTLYRKMAKYEVASLICCVLVNLSQHLECCSAWL